MADSTEITIQDALERLPRGWKISISLTPGRSFVSLRYRGKQMREFDTRTQELQNCIDEALDLAEDIQKDMDREKAEAKNPKKPAPASNVVSILEGKSS